jgi:hypothetical protein
MAGIVARAMASDPAERYPDAAALRDALADAEAPVDPDAATREIAVPVSAAAEIAGPAAAPSQPGQRQPDRRAAWVALAIGVVLAAGALAFGAGSSGGSSPSEPPAAVDGAHASPAPTAVPTLQRADVKAGAGNGKAKGKGGGKGKGKD